MHQFFYPYFPKIGCIKPDFHSLALGGCQSNYFMEHAPNGKTQKQRHFSKVHETEMTPIPSAESWYKVLPNRFI